MALRKDRSWSASCPAAARFSADPGISARRLAGNIAQLLAHGADRRGIVLRAENRGPRHKRVGAGTGHIGDVVGLDAAVDLEPDVFASGGEALARLGGLRQYRTDELLSAQRRGHRHTHTPVE